MLFNSPVFLFVFLPIAFIWHWTTIAPLRNFALFLLSLLFYWWGGNSFLYLLLISVGFNWLIGLAIGFSTHKYRTVIAGLGVLLNLVVLAYYKYANDFLYPLIGLKSFTVEHVLIPLGISFYTFHSISYLVDVCRTMKKPFLNPIDFGLYISLFPQLVAGPIVRFHDISDQIAARYFNLDRISTGVERFIYGLSKKMLLADTFAPIADHVFNLPRAELSTSAAWIGLICFTLQIYYDFSGYSDMAIGLARMFGFELLENFNYPYFADSITDFWHRWHLSLSAWFRDYLYIPLGGNRVSNLATYRNLLIVFLLCGLWHGASLNFVLWGAYNGLFLILERRINIQRFLPSIGRHLYTILVVMMGWVIFRTHSFHDTRHFYDVLLLDQGSKSAYAGGIALLLSPSLFIMMVIAIILSLPLFTFLATDFPSRRFPNKATHLDLPLSFLQDSVARHPLSIALVRGITCLILLVVCMIQMTQGTAHSYIYFTF